eukprot:5521681-Karenia_brevis.AAC.1
MLQPSSYQPSQALVYTFAPTGYDLDPNIHILWKRVNMIRRAIAKYPAQEHTIKRMLRHYQQQQHVGTKHENLNIQTLAAAPPPGAA